MKFGESLYRLSIPKWAAYNLNYNELKRLIKLRTTTGLPTPLPIPGQTDHRWSLLEDELYGILKEQYENIALFVRSKHGEIERRLAYLDKSVRSAKRTASLSSGRPSAQARKYQKLIQEADNIGEDIQSLSRFAAVQKTALRKILKKYHKWTDSDSLRQRLERQVFSDGQLEVNLTDQMQHLSAQTAVIKSLEANLLHPGALDQNGPMPQRLNTESPASQITKAAQSGILHFDVALAFTPYGEAAGTATYWIHSDNLPEARVLLLRYMRELDAQAAVSRANSVDSVMSNSSGSTGVGHTRVCFFDNGRRYMQDSSTHSPSKVALSARWAALKESLVTMSDMSPRSDYTSTLPVKKKELAMVLDRNSSAPKESSAYTANIRIIKDFMSQHRDVKALAMLQSNRIRYVGLNNSSEVGTFAALDTNITISPYDKEEITAPSSAASKKRDFPHAVLEIRWEFGRKPEVVRAFDTTHLAERVPDFTLEGAAICMQNPDLPSPSWAAWLEKDIRKVPVQARASRRPEVSIGSASGPSSTEGPPDSVFSAAPGRSTEASDTSPVASTRYLPLQDKLSNPKSKKRQARIAAQSPGRSTARYYSEYDDPDSEFYQPEAYTIFVDPNEEAPGMATVRKIGSAISGAFAWVRPGRKTAGERTPLLEDHERSTDEDGQSSESDSDERTFPQYKGIPGHIRPAERYKMRLSRRQRHFEKTLILFYSGLLVLSYIFLLMSGILLTTGRKKEVLEVDIGATVGVSVAFVCAFLSCFLVYMRKSKLSSVEWVSLFLADAVIVVLGAAVIVGIVQRATSHNLLKH